MQKIELYKGSRINKRSLGVYALVDDEDYDMLMEFSPYWGLHSQGYSFCVKNGKMILMHRLILGTTDSKVHTDHINHNRLDNQRENIIACSQKENNGNLPFTGIGWHREDKKWRVWSRSPTTYLGSFENKLDAERAIENWGRNGIREVKEALPEIEQKSSCCGVKIVRYGKCHKTGKARYQCTSCKKTFSKDIIDL